ncbi:MAG: SpoIIE family protein phosphatase [Chloroflexi bacterium]|nr:SpoIIE family protein phosphatase [Chloroflexota bacterium]
MSDATVLVVDDEPYNLDYLQQELEDAGYRVILASDGLEALERVRDRAPDLVLLDVMMPRMDGFQVLSRLKGDAATRAIPVIIISADTDLGSVVQGIRLGADDYLPKPFEPVLLHARISSGLERKRLHDLETLYLEGLEREMDIARQIQRSFLPERLPDVPGWDVAACFRSARDVAGDFYDVFTLPDGRLACVLGDVCGKGVGAALFMTLFRSLVRATLTSNCFRGAQAAPVSPREQLAEAVALINRYVAETHRAEGTFCALFAGTLDVDTGRMVYTNCGSDPPLLLRRGVVRGQLKPTGPVVGILEDVRFAVEDLLLEPGDTLVAYTDGLIDALNEAGEPFDLAGLRGALSNGAAASLVDEIERDVVAHVGEASPFDDITLVAIHRLALDG